MPDSTAANGRDNLARFADAAEVWPRGYGKNRLAEKALREAIDRGEHSHQVAIGVQKCWNGDGLCGVWRAQGGQDADPIA